MSTMRRDHPDYVRSWDDIIKEGAAYWKEHEAELSAMQDIGRARAQRDAGRHVEPLEGADPGRQA